MVQGFSASTTHLDSGIVAVHLHGYLDAYTAPQLDEMLGSLVEQGVTRVIIDCAELEYISSAGLGVFMAHLEPLRSAGGDLKICSLNERIATIMDMLGFQHIFHITEHPDQAYAAFMQHPDRQ